MANGERDHLAGLLAKAARAKEASDVVEGGSLLHQLGVLRRRALGILERAEAVNDLRTALLALREARATLGAEDHIQGPAVGRELPLVPVYSFDPDAIFPDPQPASGIAPVLPTETPPGGHANDTGGSA